MTRPLRVAILNDYNIVVAGIAAMLAPYRDRIQIVQVDGHTLGSGVDIALFDKFAQVSGDGRMDLADVIHDHGPQVVVFTWNADPVAVERALARGAAGYLSKTLPASELVQALEDIHSEAVVANTGPYQVLLGEGSGDAPAHVFDLSPREAEVLALIAKGMSNREIGEALFLSVNSIKTHIRTAYAKIGVRSRSQAVLWAHENGFPPPALLHSLSVEQGVSVTGPGYRRP